MFLAEGYVAALALAIVGYGGVGVGGTNARKNRIPLGSLHYCADGLPSELFMRTRCVMDQFPSKAL